MKPLHSLADRVMRFTPRTQIVLGIVTALLASVILTAIPLPSLALLPFSALVLAGCVAIVVWTASSVQRARNTVALTQAESVLAEASLDGSPCLGMIHQEDRDPAWASAFRQLDSEELIVVYTGRMRAQAMLDWADSASDAKLIIDDEVVPVTQRAAVTDLLTRLNKIAHTHPSVTHANEATSIKERIHLLIGQAVTGKDMETLRACPDLERDFTAVTDCVNGHLDTHRLVRVFTARGGTRRVERACAHCPSRWTERI